MPTAAGAQNPRVKQFLSLKRNLKGNPDRLVALEGLWELGRALDAGLELRAFFVCWELVRGDAGRTMAERVVGSGVHAYEVSAKVFERMADREGPDGLAAIAALAAFDWSSIALGSGSARVVVLDGLEIVGNVGTVIRCADATGCDAVVLTNRRVRLTHPKLVHSSMGMSLTVPVFEAEADEAVGWLRANGFRIVTTDAEGDVSYRHADYRGRVAVVMGSERYGISAPWHEAEDQRVFIPMAGRVDSLNVGNAAVLVLYEAFAQQQPDHFNSPG
jgi:TrmH family RNA methyltransferase